MKRLIFLFLLISAAALPAYAGPIKVVVSDVNAVGVQNRDEMKSTLQTLLASRLNGDNISAVASPAEAEVVITGTYVVLGKVFSFDALAKTTSGRTLTRAFVQGDSQDELIPAVGKLAEKLTAELVKLSPASSASAAVSGQVSVSPVPATPSTSAIIKNEQQVRQAPGEFIKPSNYEQGNTGGWISKRLNGAANLLAAGKTLPDGTREVFLADERVISYYHQSKEMKLVAEAELSLAEKIISIDSAENDGVTELYVTVMRSEEPASQVWQVKNDKLVMVAERLPYFFRSFSLAGGPKKLYAQAMGRDEDFYGDVFEAIRTGDKVSIKNPVRMPRYGNIYSFNQLRDSEGKLLTVVINPDNYLVVYDQGQKELWRSNDKFGGSELFFQKEDQANARVTGERNRWVFLNQRIQVTSKGDLLVGKNDGFWVLGNARSYKKGAVYCFSWNGSSLEEKWRTRDTQNYMPDYFYDEPQNELLMLQTVQRTGIGKRGASALAIKKVE